MIFIYNNIHIDFSELYIIQNFTLISLLFIFINKIFIIAEIVCLIIILKFNIYNFIIYL